ncbi:MAG: NTP transferase domain-containing protein [Planctomycetes bacterium]|nr:NTP transferase domain-containing protein [Planctomycetota bacterium]
MQLVVPMAGLGKRFTDAGYALPKPLIPVDGLPMVVRAVADLPPVDIALFVTHPDHVLQHRIDERISEHFPDCRVVVAPGLTEGQACTVRLAAAELDPDKPVLVAACDNTHLYDSKKLARLTVDSSIDCLIWTYRHDCRVLQKPEAHGWVRTRGNSSDVEAVSCKRTVSATPLDDHAVSGCFWFRTAQSMIDGIDSLVASDQRVNNEFYLDVVPNMLIADRRRVAVFEVEKYIGWGTPHELADYQRWERYFATQRCELVGS